MHTKHSKTYHREVFKRPGFLNIRQRLLQVLQLTVHNVLGLFGALDGLSLKRLNSLDLTADVVRLWLEGLELLLDVVDDGGVLQHASVVGEVDRRRLVAQLLHLAPGIVVALLEGHQRVRRRTLEAELCAELGPVEFEGGGTLFERRSYPFIYTAYGCFCAVNSSGGAPMLRVELKTPSRNVFDLLRRPS